MLRRLTYLEAARPLADSGTLVTEVTIRDPITVLWIFFSAVNGTTSNRNNTLAENITRFEIVDGGNTLFSLSGIELASLYWQLGNGLNGNRINELGAASQTLAVPLLFGRYAGDDEFAFDPAKYKNPQIRLQWNLASVNAVGNTGFASGSAKITLLADVMEGVAAPKGVLVAKRWDSFTSASSGVHITELPADLPIKSLMLRAYKSGSRFDNVVSNVKWTAEGGKHVALDVGSSVLLYYSQHTVPRIEYRAVLVLHNNVTLKVVPKADVAGTIGVVSGDTVVGWKDNGVGEGTVSMLTGGVATTTDTECNAEISGIAPYSSVLYNYGDPWIADEWFPASAFANHRLELTQAEADGEVSVVLQQAQPY